MDLAAHQRKLLGLVRATHDAASDKDPYIREVAQSANIELIREIAAWWRAFNVERYCVLTTSLLKSWDIFESTLEGFSKAREPSRFIERLGTEFLHEMGRHENHLISSVARFELALIRVREGDPGNYVVNWQHNPAVVLNELLRGVPPSEAIEDGYYRTVVSLKEPGLFRILKLEGSGIT